MTQESSSTLLVTVPPAVWLSITAILIALAILIHAVFPRYDYRLIEDGRVMVIYDRWAGRFQRVNYDAAGEPTLTKVLTPF